MKSLHHVNIKKKSVKNCLTSQVSANKAGPSINRYILNLKYYICSLLHVSELTVRQRKKALFALVFMYIKKGYDYHISTIVSRCLQPSIGIILSPNSRRGLALKLS